MNIELLCLLYLLVVIFIVIITIKNHRKQDLEQFKNYGLKINLSAIF